MNSNELNEINDLKTLREDKGWSLEQVSERLRLTKDVIDKLEKGEFRELGAYPYVRGYLMNYCQLLQINADKYLQMIPKKELQSELINTYSKTAKMVKFKRQSKGIGNYAIGTFFILGLSFTGWYFLKQYSMSKSNTLDLNANTTLEIQPSDSIDTQEQSNNQNDDNSSFHYSSLIPQSEDTTSLNVSEEGEMLSAEDDLESSGLLMEIPQKQEIDAEISNAKYSIELTVDETSWIEIEKEDGQRLYFDLFQPGVKKFESDLPLHFRIGNEKQVTLKINGESVDLSKHSNKDIADFNWPLNES